MKFKLKDLKDLLNKIQKHQVQHLRVYDNYFELVINNLQSFMPLNKKLDNQLVFNHQPEPTTLPEVSLIEPKTYHSTQKIDNTKALLTIVSPMVGTFYRSASPEEAPFVKISDPVKSNQTICIIEAMKLMNEIEAEVNGKIIEILVEDGEFVDCGQPLMNIKPTIK